MSNNCLVTKLKGVVDNDNLLKVGEMRIGVYQIDSPSATTQKFTIKTSGEVTLTPIGGSIGLAYDSLSSNPITVNNEEKTIYFSNSAFEISVSKKYLIKKFTCSYSNIGLNVDDLAYSPLNAFISSSTHIEGTLKAFKNCPINAELSVEKSSVSGVLGDIANLPITVMNISDTSISGDIADISSMNTLTVLYCTNSAIEGDIADMPKSLITTELNSLMHGSINDMKGFANLMTCSMPKGVTGALETLAQNLAEAGNTRANIRITFKDFNCTIGGNPITAYRVYIHLDGPTPTIDYTQKA